MNNWKEHFETGLQYATTIKKLNPEHTKLDGETIYNIVCMGSEYMLTALLGAYGEVAEHSTISGMLRMLATKTEVTKQLIDDSRFLNKFNTYCSLDKVEQKPIGTEDVVKMKDFILQLGPFLMDLYIAKSGKYSNAPS